MTELAFTFCNSAVMPGWACLALAPRWPHTRTAVFAGVGANAVAYVTHLLTAERVEDASFLSLKGVRNIFMRGDANVHMVCWLHYLAFDVLVGLMEVEDAQREGVRHAAVVPCLGLTLLYGPAGALAYAVVRFASMVLRKRSA
mmetsp:Transcript_27449/g.81820  ORF Transcript_27449/g.81820 Transcript_27449/m.81820 type:complete len:143 (-) Transcript_27449:87-515(-)